MTVPVVVPPAVHFTPIDSQLYSAQLRLSQSFVEVHAFFPLHIFVHASSTHW